MTGDRHMTEDGDGGAYVVLPSLAQRIGDQRAFVLLSLLFMRHGREPFSLVVGPNDPWEILQRCLQRLCDCGEMARVAPGRFQITGNGIQTLEEYVSAGMLVTAPAQGTA